MKEHVDRRYPHFEICAGKAGGGYEFARAVCKIHLEIEFDQKQDRGSIDSDLLEARDVSADLKKAIDKDDAIKAKDGNLFSAVQAWGDLTGGNTLQT